VVGVALAIRSKEDMLSVWHSNNANDKIRFFIGYGGLLALQADAVYPLS